MAKTRALLNRVLLPRGYRIERARSPDLFQSLLLRHLERNGKTARFLQIGANDGKRFDPIHKFITSSRYSFSGVVVEPVPRYFRDLQTTYKDYPDIVPLNFAIHEHLETIEMFCVAERHERDVPEWALGTASFSKEHVVKEEVPESYVEAVTVPCITLPNLCEKYGFEEIDLLQLDAEGYDKEILYQLISSSIRPKIINFEHGVPNGTMSKDELQNIVTALNGCGYQLVLEQLDAVAILAAY